MTTTQPQTIVRNLMSQLTAAGFSPEWLNTGGGCYRIYVPIDDTHGVAIVDREDVYAAADLDSDADVYGFYVLAVDLVDDEELYPVMLDGSDGVLMMTASFHSEDGEQIDHAVWVEAIAEEIPAVVARVRDYADNPATYVGTGPRQYV